MPPGRHRRGQDPRQKPKTTSVRLPQSVIQKATQIGQGDLQVGLRRAVHVLGLDIYPPPVPIDRDLQIIRDGNDQEPLVKDPLNVTLTYKLYKQAMSLGYQNVSRGLRIAVRLFPQEVIDAEVGQVHTPEPTPQQMKVTTASLTNNELRTALALGEIPGAKTLHGKPMVSAGRGSRYVIDRLMGTPLDPQVQIDVESEPGYRLTAKESIRLTPEQYDYVLEIGDGNVARGIRYALRVGAGFVK